MTTTLICPCCGNGYDEFYPGMARKFKAHVMKVRRQERQRIREALSKAYQVVKGLTPGAGGPEDEWIHAARNMYEAALQATRR